MLSVTNTILSAGLHRNVFSTCSGWTANTAAVAASRVTVTQKFKGRSRRSMLAGDSKSHTRTRTAAIVVLMAKAVDGIYTADPEKDPSAKKISRITAQELARLAAGTEMKAGSRSPVDPLAAKIIERSRIPTAIVLGSKIENLRKGALGGHTGTEIRQA